MTSPYDDAEALRAHLLPLANWIVSWSKAPLDGIMIKTPLFAAGEKMFDAEQRLIGLADERFVDALVKLVNEMAS